VRCGAPRLRPRALPRWTRTRQSLNFALESEHPANSKEVSALGQKSTWQHVGTMSALPMEADVTAKPVKVDGSQALMAWAVSNARVEPKGNAIVITKQASGTAKIDPLMAAFNAVAWMSANPATSQPSIFVI
jgi:hypothetical protein